MTSNLAFSSSTLLLVAGTIMASIILLIYVIRWRLSKNNQIKLSEKYRDWKWTSPLEGRNKYPEANVFQYANSFFLLGLLISLGLTYTAFNWTSYEKAIYIPDNALAFEEDIEIEPPRSDIKPPPPPPPPPPVIQEVPDALFEEEDQVEFLDQSIDENTEMAESSVPDAPKVVEKAAPPPPPPSPPPAAEPEVEEIFQVVEEMPRFAGCEEEPDKMKRKACADKRMLEFIYSNIKYPTLARENNITGTVVIRFYVDKDGSVKETKILKDVGGGCGAEAMRVINLMNVNDRWIPGRQRATPVKVWFNLPVKFKLV